VSVTQLGSPNGRPRLTQQRNAATSASVCGWLTSCSQSVGRGKGHVERMGNAPHPCHSSSAWRRSSPASQVQGCRASSLYWLGWHCDSSSCHLRHPCQRHACGEHLLHDLGREGGHLVDLGLLFLLVLVASQVDDLLVVHEREGRAVCSLSEAGSITPSPADCASERTILHGVVGRRMRAIAGSTKPSPR
jgi:hypothetical protein